MITTLVERHGQGGSGEPHRDEPYDSSFLVADPTGGFIIETCNRTWAVRPVGAGAAISNRISLATDWTWASADVAPGTNFDTYRWARMPTAHADERLAVTSAAVCTDHAPTVGDLTHVLRSHGVGRNADELPVALDDEGHGFSVCMHRRELHSQTTASLIAELSESAPPRVWVALGNPCCSVYVPSFPPAVAPELAEASEWERFARLRNQVEAAPGERAEVRADSRCGRNGAVGGRRRGPHLGPASEPRHLLPNGLPPGGGCAASTRRLATHYGRPGVRMQGAR